MGSRVLLLGRLLLVLHLEDNGVLGISLQMFTKVIEEIPFAAGASI